MAKKGMGGGRARGSGQSGRPFYNDKCDFSARDFMPGVSSKFTLSS